jgi:hypothetical protein
VASSCENGKENLVRFQVLAAAIMKMTVFWNVAQCSLVEVYCSSP